ncbi:hypothetical protein AOQ88_00990 [Candidatus Riesia sp. GBBU]|nr:hypothetical protein AOQ88_00990 [Candidatus Riesia sp. GBBU]
MSIKTIVIFKESINLFTDKIKIILLFSSFASFISNVFQYLLNPIKNLSGNEQFLSFPKNETLILTWMNILSQEEKSIIIKIILSSIISSMIGKIFLFSFILTYLREIYLEDRYSFFKTVYYSLKITPDMSILVLLCYLVSYFGFLFFFFPGVILLIGFSFSPIILVIQNKILPIKSMKKSLNISFKYWKKILLIFMILSVFQILIIFLINSFNVYLNYLYNNTIKIVSNVFNSFVLIYLFRLYILIQKMIKH